MACRGSFSRVRRCCICRPDQYAVSQLSIHYQYTLIQDQYAVNQLSIHYQYTVTSSFRDYKNKRRNLETVEVGVETVAVGNIGDEFHGELTVDL